MRNRNLGILTQPLHQNYGGLLQAYALQTVLKRMGYNPIVLDRYGDAYNRPVWLQRFLSHSKTVLLKTLGRYRSFIYYPTNKEYQYISKNTDFFIKKYIQPKSPRLYSQKKLSQFLGAQKMDGFIVGSDQVWRPCYSPHLPTYFLDFVETNKDVKKIAYAASFGVDKWEFSDDETEIAKHLLPLFDAVSVREDSGVTLCENYLGVQAEHVLDPTMLLDKEDYISLIKAECEPQSEGDLFTYILDPSEHKQKIVDNLADKLKLKPFEVQPKYKHPSKDNIKKNIEGCVYPTVTKWLRAFYDAKFVVTDSFHGCVFSIIFNKPFIAIGNEDRGLARFKSLLSLYGLENRLNNINPDSLEVIDWAFINNLRMKLKEKSFDFLKENLDGKYSS